MTKLLRAHFDGKVFVPDEPVDIPIGAPLELSVHCRSEVATDVPDHNASMSELADWIESLPPSTKDASPGDRAAEHDHYLYGRPK